MVEEICLAEELNEQMYVEHNLNKLKAGNDIENSIVMNYLTNENKY